MTLDEKIKIAKKIILESSKKWPTKQSSTHTRVHPILDFTINDKNAPERAGREATKEKTMERLRKLGYW